jgi:hypothetical protein
LNFFNVSLAGRVVILSLIVLNGVIGGFAQSHSQTRAFLPRTTLLRTGSQFVAYIAHMDSRSREQAILKEVLGGNVPDFLRSLVPVKLDNHSADGKTRSATVFVMPEYLAIGSNEDYVRIPMNLYTASGIASGLGFVLPTRKIVNAIYSQAAFHFAPQPMTPGPQMTSTEYYRVHNQKIEAQSRLLGVTPGALVSGDKKDVVVTHLLASNPGKLAIYGWHRLTGAPIQPLSTVHGACYADYSHGIRLISETAVVDGQSRSIYDLLGDPQLAGVLSDDGPIPNLRGLISHMAEEPACGPPVPPPFGPKLTSGL